VAIDWGGTIIDLGGQIIDAFVGDPDAPAGGVPFVVPPGTPSSRAAVVKCKPRRRRRRLLTEGDFNDLMRIATLPNKQNVTVALAKAVGRR